MSSILKLRWFWAAVFCCLISTTGYCESAFTSDVKSGPYPWTHTRFLESGDDFHFAIVADRNGGCRPGIFESAVEKLNLLRPSFVMSVGDFISGYTDNVDSLRGQWAEVNGIFKKLEPPFFFVPGNHDYSRSNVPPTVRSATETVWQEQHGPTYYSFIYKNTLFICLNSMGGEDHRWGLGDAQFAWAKDVLAKNPKVRWTFVFLHNPLWEEEAKHDVKAAWRFSEFEKALAGRNYTVFAGHWHEYARYDRQGMKYFILATTGGGSPLSGPEWGDFDQIMWVSMCDSGPRFSNLELSGILDDDVCTQAVLNLKESVQFTPMDSAQAKNEVGFVFSFKNTFATPLKVTLRWMDNTICSIQPKEKNDVVAPGAIYSTPFHIRFKGDTILPIPKVTCSFDTEKFKACRDYTPSPDCLGEVWNEKIARPVVRINSVPKIDGKLDEVAWQRPATVDGFACYDLSGMATLKTQTWFAYDDKNLYVAWRCSEKDMKTMVAEIKNRDGSVWADDSVEFFLDTKLDHATYYHFGINTLGTLYDALVGSGNINSNAQVAVFRNQDCWTVEFAVAWKDLNVQSPRPGTRMGYELARERPRNADGEEPLSQFPPLGSPFNHQPKLFGELIFGQ